MKDNLKSQKLAARAMERVAAKLRPGQSEAEIARMAEAEMTSLGSEGWWYHGVGALVLAGRERSLLSVSGRDYQPREDVVLGQTDLVSLDFSPIWNGAWGDYARTIFLERGQVVPLNQCPATEEFAAGYAMERYLHRSLMAWASPEKTYQEVWSHLNGLLEAQGWENCDFHGNLGHSIEENIQDRIYLERGNLETLGGHGTPFTFEPHIRKRGGNCAFKHENIYYFSQDGSLRCLTAE